MKRILLIVPNSSFLDSDRVFPHIGILHLLSVAENLGLRIQYINKKYKVVCDGVFYTDEFDFDDIEYYGMFDLIGISCTTPQAPTAYLIKNKIRELNPDIKIIIGGPHAEHYAAECEVQGFDLICAGDGEKVFEEILTGKHIFEKNIQYMTTGNLTTKEMNSYPIPLRQKEYINRYTYMLKDRLATTIVNSRGCPMKCTFCENSNTKCRWYSTEHFRKQIESIVALKIKGIMIFDDIFAVSPTRVSPYLEILKEYHEKEDLIFRCFGHAKIIATFPELAKKLADSGCVEMGFGAESADQRILNTIKKTTSVQDMHTFVETVIKNDINVKAFFMIGLPGENEFSIKRTYNFIEYYKVKYPDNFDFDLTVFFPYKGTEIGNTMRHNSELVNLRLLPEYTWKDIDTGNFGAYKKKDGASDIVIESYDWDSKKVLLSAKDILYWKNNIMKLSNRYKTDIVYEGSICHK